VPEKSGISVSSGGNPSEAGVLTASGFCGEYTGAKRHPRNNTQRPQSEKRRLVDVRNRSFLASSFCNAPAERKSSYSMARCGAPMSLQKESELHDYLSSQPSIVRGQHSLAMHCANPQCSKELLYLRDGTLRLLELEPLSDCQFRPDDGAFATRSLPSKYFWLCGECTKTHIVKRWTTSGVVLVSRSLKRAGSPPSLVDRPATAATSPPLPVSMTVPPIGRPLHRVA
jgi:hypothetical protein